MNICYTVMCVLRDEFISSALFALSIPEWVLIDGRRFHRGTSERSGGIVGTEEAEVAAL